MSGTGTAENMSDIICMLRWHRAQFEVRTDIQGIYYGRIERTQSQQGQLGLLRYHNSNARALMSLAAQLSLLIADFANRLAAGYAAVASKAGAVGVPTDTVQWLPLLTPLMTSHSCPLCRAAPSSWPGGCTHGLQHHHASPHQLPFNDRAASV